MNFLSATASLAFDAALALVYPQACAICGRSVESRHDGVACSRCWDEAPLFHRDQTLCWKCGAISLSQVGDDQRETVRCGLCDDYAFTAARACGLYEGAVRVSVLELKRQPHAPRRLVQLLGDLQQREPLNRADVIIPVPLHRDREAERGFNQAAVLARELAHVSGLPLDEHSVSRRLHTERHRAGMDAKARRQSVLNAFAVRHPEQLAGRRVLLVDDVFTTGATVSACGGVIRNAGAEAVLVISLGRVGRNIR